MEGRTNTSGIIRTKAADSLKVAARVQWGNLQHPWKDGTAAGSSSIGKYAVIFFSGTFSNKLNRAVCGERNDCFYLFILKVNFRWVWRLSAREGENNFVYCVSKYDRKL